MTKWETCVDPSGGLESRGLDGQSQNNVFNTLVVQGLYIANTRTRRKWKARHFPGDAFSLKHLFEMRTVQVGEIFARSCGGT
ncbi:hypothetical protein D5086_010944 [Populus alba]|uniref:Uncharacterized protein n=1 Tax=Populus alba TaxID=43335 RepID=A0ACC4CB24_POPAL